MAGSEYEWDRTVGGRDAVRAQREQDAIISRTPFPVPDAKTLPFPKFCDYWNTLIQQPVSKYARIYVRRWFPVLLPEEIEDVQSGLTRESHPSEKKYIKDDGPLDEKKLLSDIGVGDYTFRLNDTRRPWEQATIVHGEKLSTMRNWDLYPPVFDKKRLDWDDDANRVYIKWAQSRQFLPQEKDAEKEQADMAQANVVETVMNDARAERARADQLQKEALERAERETREAKEAAARAQAEAAKSQTWEPNPPASDLLNVVTSVAALAKSLQPAKDDSLSKYLELQQEREKTQRETEKAEREAARAQAAVERARADELQAQIIANLKEATKPATPQAVVAPKTDVDLLEEMVKKQNLMKQLMGRGGSSQEEDTSKPSNIDKWMEAAPILGPIVQGVIGGIFQTIHFGLQTWQQISYNNALGKNGGEPKPPMSMEKPPEPGKPIPPQAPPQTPEQQAQQAQWNLIMQGVQTLTPHLIRFLDKGKSGAELAEFIIENSDEQRTSYDRIRHLAESLALIGLQIPGANDLEKFTAACRFVFEKIPPLWAKVATLPTMPQFLADFYNYDEIREEEERRMQEQQ